VPGSLVGVVSAFDERLDMTLPGSLARHDGHRARTLVVLRFLSFVRAPMLDAELAAGIRPSASTAHQLRANHLRRIRVRRRIAIALNRAVDDANCPVRHGTPQAPLSREAVRCCCAEIRELAALVASLENPRTQGVAIAFQLAFDGSGPLFFRPDPPDGTERLANTVRAARSALRVSADFE
jgi:hypothetical protein